MLVEAATNTVPETYFIVPEKAKIWNSVLHHYGRAGAVTRYGFVSSCSLEPNVYYIITVLDSFLLFLQCPKLINIFLCTGTGSTGTITVGTGARAATNCIPGAFLHLLDPYPDPGGHRIRFQCGSGSETLLLACFLLDQPENLADDKKIRPQKKISRRTRFHKDWFFWHTQKFLAFKNDKYSVS
jgi:hypothetical protein